LAKNRHFSRLVSIRLALPKDATAISSLYFEWLNFGEPKGRIKEIKKSIRDKELLVAIDRELDEPIGFIQGMLSNDTISSGPIVYIASFYLKVRFRRKGIGSMLLGALLRRARSQGAVGVEVATAQRPAFKLYKKFGFTRYHADFGERLLGLDLKKMKRRMTTISS
jgi:ribosomal protein S18 acetylase RimI-like enzyme